MAKEVARLEGPRPRAKDALYLAHLAEMAGRPAEAARHRAKALELDPRLSEEMDAPPGVTLDYLLMEDNCWIWDDLNSPEPANNLTDDALAVFHAYRYMRTLGQERLEKTALRQPGYEEMLSRSEEFRGRVVSVRGRYVKWHKSIRWTGRPEHVAAGLRDLDFCFVLDSEGKGVYLVAVPHETASLKDSDIVNFTGLYMRRWSFYKGGRWHWRPWVVALELEPLAIEEGAGLTWLLLGVLGVVIVSAFVMFVAARRESKEDRELREKRLTMRRGERDRIRRKVADAVAGDAGGPGKDPPGGPDEGA
jgi:hypothetical protein